VFGAEQLLEPQLAAALLQWGEWRRASKHDEWHILDGNPTPAQAEARGFGTQLGGTEPRDVKGQASQPAVDDFGPGTDVLGKLLGADLLFAQDDGCGADSDVGVHDSVSEHLPDELCDVANGFDDDVFELSLRDRPADDSFDERNELQQLHRVEPELAKKMGVGRKGLFAEPLGQHPTDAVADFAFDLFVGKPGLREGWRRGHVGTLARSLLGQSETNRPLGIWWRPERCWVNSTHPRVLCTCFSGGVKDETPVDLNHLIARIETQGRARVKYYRDGRWQQASAAEFLADVATVAARLETWGVQPRSRVGIQASNCYEWLVHDLALLKLGAVSVAIPDQLGTTCDDLARDHELALLLLPQSAAGQANRSWVTGLTGPFPADTRVRAVGKGDFFENDDVFTMVPSSGTSGVIKTLVVTKSGVAEVLESFVKRYPMSSEDRVLMFLPLFSVQQRLISFGALWYGLELVVSSAHLLLRSLTETSPTLFVGPPMFYEAIHRRFVTSTSAWQRALLRVASAAAGVLPRPVRSWVLRRLFAPIHAALGGQIRWMITGMAHTRVSTLRFFARAGLELYEAYGLSECGLVSGNGPRANRRGSVGRPFAGAGVSIASDGEIVVRRSRHVAIGYWKHDPHDSKTVFPAADTVATGDLGRFDRHGFLYITGRKKEILVTAGGAKVHPEPIENAIRECAGVEQCAVVGDELAASLVAVVYISGTAGTAARAQVERQVGLLSRSLPHGAEIRATIFSEVPFTPDNGLLTRNLKLDRRKILAHFTGATRSARMRQAG
jgi:long-chain acyl-CoA synthetase